MTSTIDPECAFHGEGYASAPELLLDYQPTGAITSPKQAMNVHTRLSEFQYVYPEPAQPDSDCAHAWFADRGWTYATHKKQGNTFAALSMPEWLRDMAHAIRVLSPVARTTTGWNSCLVSYGTHSRWTHGEDPWNEEHSLSGEIYLSADGHSRVQLQISKDDVSFSLTPRPGSFFVWRGLGWTVQVHSEMPFYRIAFRLISPMYETRQHKAKYHNRFAAAMAKERRVIPAFVVPLVTGFDTKPAPVVVTRKRPEPELDQDAEAERPEQPRPVVHVQVISTIDKPRKGRRVAPPPAPRK